MPWESEQPTPPEPVVDAPAGRSLWLDRILATLLDTLVVIVVVGVPSFLVGLAIGGEAGEAVYVVLTLLGTLLYAPLLLARGGERNGQTIGKQQLGLRVQRLDGQPVSFGTGALREMLGKGVPTWLTVGIYFVVDALWPRFDDREQALHDKLASTIVVRGKNQPG